MPATRSNLVFTLNLLCAHRRLMLEAILLLQRKRSGFRFSPYLLSIPRGMERSGIRTSYVVGVEAIFPLGDDHSILRGGGLEDFIRTEYIFSIFSRDINLPSPPPPSKSNSRPLIVPDKFRWELKRSFTACPCWFKTSVSRIFM